MNDALSESAIVKAVADEAARRITRKVIGAFQQMTVKLSGDDSLLESTWDEICVQVQDEESYSWDAYEQTVRGFARQFLAEIPKHERDAIWLQTEAGFAWSWEAIEDREQFPVIDDEIVAFLIGNYILAAAENWSNARIRAYIDQSSRRD